MPTFTNVCGYMRVGFLALLLCSNKGPAGCLPLANVFSCVFSDVLRELTRKGETVSPLSDCYS